MSAFAQEQADVDSSTLFFQYADAENVLITDSIEYSKELDGFEQYSPALDYGNFFQRQSNVGQAVKRLDPDVDYFLGELDRDLIFSNPYYPYMWRKDNIRYYTSIKPVTDLYYVMGTNKEQLLRVLHAQPLAQRLYFSVEFSVLHSPGSYRHHLANHESPVFNLRYHTKSNKYHVLATYFHNKVDADDNGGIRELTYFTDSAAFEERSLIPVNLEQAKVFIRGGGAHLRQEFYPAADSSSSVESLTVSIYHDLYYQKDSYKYTDGGNRNGFYPGMQDIGNIMDSTATKQLVNKAGARFNFRKISFDLGVAHSYYELWQNENDTFANAFSPLASARFEHNKWFINLAGQLDFFDQQREWKIAGNIKKSFKKFDLEFRGGAMETVPAMLLATYNSTYYNWNRGFDDTRMTYLSGEFSNKYLNAAMSLYNTSGYIYFDPLGIPQQDQNSFQFAQIRIAPEIKWRDFTLKSTNVFQQSIGANLLRLPAVMTKNKFYYGFHLIKDVLKTQAGFQFTWHSSFYGDRYIPATMAFAMQNSQLLGDYPYIDVFANFHIKRARIFVRYSHINALLENKAYFMMPSYPMRDDSFQFGISWMFYD